MLMQVLNAYKQVKDVETKISVLTANVGPRPCRGYESGNKHDYAVAEHINGLLAVRDNNTKRLFDLLGSMDREVRRIPLWSTKKERPLPAIGSEKYGADRNRRLQKIGIGFNYNIFGDVDSINSPVYRWSPPSPTSTDPFDEGFNIALSNIGVGDVYCEVNPSTAGPGHFLCILNPLGRKAE